MNQESKAAERSDVILCLAVSLPVLASFLFVSFYNHPIGDDFWCTAMVRKYGFWRAQSELYDIVPPRYLELAVSCLAPLSFGKFFGYKIIPIFSILLLIYVMAGLLKTLTGTAYRNTVLASTVFVTLFLCVVPGLAEGIYWVSALAVYYLGMVLFVIWCNYLLKWYHKERKPYYSLVVCLCLAGIFGCNELISTIVLAVLCVVFLERVISRKGGIDGLLLVQFFVAIVCLYFVFQYKGTGNRYSLLKNRGSGRLFYSIGHALMLDGYYICRALINPFFWAIALPGYGIFRRLVSGAVLLPEIFRYRLYFFITWVFIMVFIPFSMFYLTGAYCPLRVSNMIIFFFLMGLVWAAAIVVQGKFKAKLNFSGRILIPAVCLLVLAGVILPNNVSKVARDLYSGSAREYDKAWDKRIELIRQCKADSCIVPHYRQIPFAFKFEPDAEEPRISEYFNRTIIVR